jgi:hypothetical protein
MSSDQSARGTQQSLFIGGDGLEANELGNNYMNQGGDAARGAPLLGPFGAGLSTPSPAGASLRDWRQQQGAFDYDAYQLLPSHGQQTPVTRTTQQFGEFAMMRVQQPRGVPRPTRPAFQQQPQLANATQLQHQHANATQQQHAVLQLPAAEEQQVDHTKAKVVRAGKMTEEQIVDLLKQVQEIRAHVAEHGSVGAKWQQVASDLENNADAWMPPVKMPTPETLRGWFDAMCDSWKNKQGANAKKYQWRSGTDDEPYGEKEQLMEDIMLQLSEHEEKV